MMFGQYPEETQNLMDQAATHPYDAAGPDAGFFHNVGGDIPNAYTRGGAQLLMLGTDAVAGVDKWMGSPQPSQTLTDWHNSSLGLLASLRPDPHTVGMAGQLLGGLTQAAPAMAGGFLAGGPVGMAAATGVTQGYTDFRMGQSEGLDTTTAAERATLTGVTSAAGAVLPVGIGASPVTKVITGAIGNVAFGAGERKATSALLEARGYHDMAQQYKALDSSSLLADGVMGAAFGGVAALHVEHEPSPLMVDAAMMAKNAQQLEVDSAPGVPLDAETRSNHLSAMKTATDQLLNDRPVDLSGVASADMHFAPDGTAKLSADHAMMLKAVDEAGFEGDRTQIQAPDGKIQALKVDFDTQAAEVKGINSRLEQINDQIDQPLSFSEKVSLINPELGARMQALEKVADDETASETDRETASAQWKLAAESTDGKGIPEAVAARQERLQAQATDLQDQLTDGQAKLSEAAKKIEGKASAIEPYTRIPRKPVGLADWVRKQGGLSDAGGDVKSMIGKAKYRPGLINRAGKSADHMALAAMENGYFPEKGGERPTQNEFLDKLAEDLHGNAQHSEHDAAALDAYHQALAHNDEIDRMAGQYGVETAGKTSEQVWAEISNHMTEEERLHQADEMADSYRRDLKEAQKLHKAWLASRGEAWEASIQDRSRRATLEDLENDRKQENAAAGARDGSTGAGGSRTARAGEGAVQERGRQSGDGAADAGSDEPAGAGAVKRPGEYETNAEQILAENPHMPIVTGELDKDGNPEIITAREAMAREDLLDQNNEVQKRVVQAAVNCFLRWS